MKEPKIAQKAPYVQDTKAGKHFYCTCGLSAKQPFCDGKHKGTNFKPLMIEIVEDKKVAWCGCKHSKKEAFCDGSHTKL